jgi:predicted transcriptional regulator
MDLYGDEKEPLAELLRKLRKERRVSQLQLADSARVRHSVVQRAERGVDARLSTWRKLFEGLGYYLRIDVQETCEEVGDLLTEEQDRRRIRRHWY